MEDLSAYRQYKNHLIVYEEMSGVLECWVGEIVPGQSCSPDKVAHIELSDAGSITEAVKLLFPKAQAYVDAK